MGWLSPVSPAKNRKCASPTVRDGLVKRSPILKSSKYSWPASGMVASSITVAAAGSRPQGAEQEVREALRQLRGRPRTARAVPLRDPVDGAQHGESGELDVHLAEDLGARALGDHRADTALEVIPLRDVPPPARRAEALDVGQHDGAVHLLRDAADVRDENLPQADLGREPRGGGVAQGAEAALHGAHVALVQQVVLVLEVVVEAALRHAEPLGDLAHRDAGDAPLLQDEAEAVEDLPPAQLGARRAPRRTPIGSAQYRH